MDAVNERTIPGTFNGTIVGPGAVIEKPGIKGQSLAFPQDAYVDYVTADTTPCIRQADDCTQGVTFAMWLWLEEGMTGKHNFILRSDLDKGDNLGYRVKYLADRNIVKIKVSTYTTVYQDELRIEISKWVHIAFTWHLRDGLRVFANGCTAGHAYKVVKTSLSSIGIFRIGSASTDLGKCTATMKIDDLLVWYKMLTPDQIWLLYVSGCWAVSIFAASSMFWRLTNTPKLGGLIKD